MNPFGIRSPRSSGRSGRSAERAMAARIGCVAGAGRGLATGAAARIGCMAGAGRGLATGAAGAAAIAGAGAAGAGAGGPTVGRRSSATGGLVAANGTVGGVAGGVAGAAAPTASSAGGMLARRPMSFEKTIESRNLAHEGSATRPIPLSPSPSPPRAEVTVGDRTVRSGVLRGSSCQARAMSRTKPPSRAELLLHKPILHPGALRGPRGHKRTTAGNFPAPQRAELALATPILPSGTTPTLPSGPPTRHRERLTTLFGTAHPPPPPARAELALATPALPSEQLKGPRGRLTTLTGAAHPPPPPPRVELPLATPTLPSGKLKGPRGRLTTLSGTAHPPPPPPRDVVVPNMNLMPPIKKNTLLIPESSAVKSNKDKRPRSLLHANELHAPSNSSQEIQTANAHHIFQKVSQPQRVKKLEVRKNGMPGLGEGHVNHGRPILKQVRLPFYYSGTAHPPPPPPRDELVPNMNLMPLIENTTINIPESSTVQSAKGKRPLGLLHANELQTPSKSSKRRSARHLSDDGNKIRSSRQSIDKDPIGLTQSTRALIFESQSKEMVTHGQKSPAVGVIDALHTSQELLTSNVPPIFPKVSGQPQSVEKLEIRKNGMPASGGHVDHVRPIFKQEDDSESLEDWGFTPEEAHAIYSWRPPSDMCYFCYYSNNKKGYCQECRPEAFSSFDEFDLQALEDIRWKDVMSHHYCISCLSQPYGSPLCKECAELEAYGYRRNLLPGPTNNITPTEEHEVVDSSETNFVHPHGISNSHRVYAVPDGAAKRNEFGLYETYN